MTGERIHIHVFGMLKNFSFFSVKSELVMAVVTPTPIRGRGIVFDQFLCLFISLFNSLFVSLSAR